MEKLLKDNRELEGDVAYWRELAKEREDMNSRRTSIDSPLQPSSAVLPESDDAQEVLREDMADAQDDGHEVRILDENEEENQEENEEESEEAHEEEKEDQDMKITGDAPPGVDVDNCPTPTSDKFSPTQFDEWVKEVDEEQAAFDPRVFSENDRLTDQTQDEHNDQDEQDEQDEQDQQDEQHQQQQQQQEEQQEQQQDEQDRHDEESGDATEAQITALVAEPEEALEAREEDDSEALQLEAEEVYTLELPKQEEQQQQEQQQQQQQQQQEEEEKQQEEQEHIPHQEAEELLEEHLPHAEAEEVPGQLCADCTSSDNDEAEEVEALDHADCQSKEQLQWRRSQCGGFMLVADEAADTPVPDSPEPAMQDL